MGAQVYAHSALISPDHHRPSEETCKYVMVELQQQGREQPEGMPASGLPLLGKETVLSIRAIN